MSEKTKQTEAKPVRETLEQMLERLNKMYPEPPPPSPEEQARREAAWEAERARQDEAERRQREKRLIAELNVPARHWKLANPDRSGPWGEQETKLRGLLGSGFLIALVGPRGTGKTQLAVELIRYATQEKRGTALFVSATEFFMRIRGTYGKDSPQSEIDVIKEFRKPRFLVIEEAGKRGETRWEDQMLFELLDKRYGDKKDTLLLANMPRAEFITSIGASLASRMDETGGIIEYNGPSFR